MSTTQPNVIDQAPGPEQMTTQDFWKAVCMYVEETRLRYKDRYGQAAPLEISEANLERRLAAARGAERIRFEDWTREDFIEVLKVHAPAQRTEALGRRTIDRRIAPTNSRADAALGRVREPVTRANAVVDPQPLEAAAHSTTVTERQRQEARWLATTERWNELVGKELQHVRERAQALEQRLVERATTLREQITALGSEKPHKPGPLGVLTGARRSYEASLQAWSRKQTQLMEQARRLERLLVRIHGYTLEAAPFPTKASQLAAKRVQTRHPDLAAQLVENSHQRQEQEHTRHTTRLARTSTDYGRTR